MWKEKDIQLFKAMSGSYGIKIFSEAKQGTSSSAPPAEVGGVPAVPGFAEPAAAGDSAAKRDSGASTGTSDVQQGSATAKPVTTPAAVNNQPSELRGLGKYILRDEVTSAEILWALNCCVNHITMSAGGSSAALFGRMFPDSVIANKMELGRLKIAYILVYGLAKYFREELLDDLKDCKHTVVLFDESLNKCAQRQQMDLAVRFWSSKLDEVSTRYLTSAFLGRARAVDLLEALKAKVPVDLLKRVEMVSMDGPNVNLKFLKDLQLDLEKNPHDPILLIMGSCGLHVVNNALLGGTAAEK